MKQSHNKIQTRIHLLMENLSIVLTLMRNSRKIEINVKQISAYKAVVLGFGSIMSLTERLEGCDFVIVDESVPQIDELIIGCKKNAGQELSPIK